MIEFLLALAIGVPVWFVLYFGFFYWLDHMIRRGIEDPNTPVYRGPPKKPVVPVPPRWNFGDRDEFKDASAKTKRAIDLYRPN